MTHGSTSRLLSSAELRGDLPEALRLWTAARRRFPLDRVIQERLFQVRMRLVELDPDMARRAESDPARPDDQGMHAIMMSFESLGGARFGCEFGGVQRAFGAEPLGLLRWVDIAPDDIINALEQRFAGVGQPEGIEIFTYRTGDNPEDGTRDLRYNMVMHTFVPEGAMSADKVLQNSCRRLQYLTRKIIDDLQSGTKIFVYKITYDNLTPGQLAQLHAAVRAYGAGTLLYVRYADAEHPDGTVTHVAPGLLVGYMDHFGASRDGKLLPLPVDFLGGDLPTCA